MTDMLTLEQHNSLYKEMHKDNIFNGYSLRTWIPEISRIIKNSNITELLDFGCGKANCWYRYDLKNQLNLDRIGLYDPGVEKFSVLPQDSYDMVICIDVLEHIPENLLDTVLDQIFSRAKKIVFLTISTKLAQKILPNGNNAHVTVRPEKWWLERLKKYETLTITHFD